jgi:death on curing protein
MTEPTWIDARDALALHERLLSIYGGSEGLRDPALLESALARPRQLRAYAETSILIGLAAAYTFGLVRDHPFVDGNKRTGFIVGVLFFELNGREFTATEEGTAQAVLALAGAEIDEAGYAEFLHHCSR